MSDWYSIYDELSDVAETIRLGFAYNRKTFKERLSEYLTGAIGEYYKARIAEANGITQYVQHWDTEVWQLLDRFMRVYGSEVKGFRDVEKAAFEVIHDVKQKDRVYQRRAFNALTGNYKFDVHIVDLQEASDSFFSGIETQITSLMAHIRSRLPQASKGPTEGD